MSPRNTPLHLEPVEPHMCSPALRLEILGGVPFFAGLEQDDLEQVSLRFREKGYQSGEVVYYEGDPAEQLYVVADGTLRLIRYTSAGRSVLLDLLVQGEFTGSLGGPEDELYHETSEAHTPVCLLTIGRQEFRQILGLHPEAALAVLDLTYKRLATSRQTVLALSAYTAEQRIAQTLLTLARKLGKPAEQGLLIQTPLSREDLAHLTGTTTETASRVMSQLQKDGLIASGRGWVAILDKTALERRVEVEF
jgi:CRP/FNR family transcriptional regulator, nitrogen oxide reductase regulator